MAFKTIKLSDLEYIWLRDTLQEGIRKRGAIGETIDNLKKKFDLEKVM